MSELKEPFRVKLWKHWYVIVVNAPEVSEWVGRSIRPFSYHPVDLPWRCVAVRFRRYAVVVPARAVVRRSLWLPSTAMAQSAETLAKCTQTAAQHGDEPLWRGQTPRPQVLGQRGRLPQQALYANEYEPEWIVRGVPYQVTERRDRRGA